MYVVIYAGIFHAAKKKVILFWGILAYLVTLLNGIRSLCLQGKYSFIIAFTSKGYLNLIYESV